MRRATGGAAGGAAAPLEFIGDPSRARAALHPLRLRLLEALARGEATAPALAERLSLPRQTINYHLARLAEQRLIRPREQGRVGRRIDRAYRLTARSFLIAPSALAGVGVEPGRIADKFSSAYLAAVTARAQRDLQALERAAARTGKRLPTFTLEADVRFASAADQAAFAEALAQSFAALVARHHAPTGRTFRFFIAGHPAVPGRPPNHQAEEK
jgi:DNA-binding transcriptional ArsR family regulator